jgi:hypothetical protein
MEKTNEAFTLSLSGSCSDDIIKAATRRSRVGNAPTGRGIRHESYVVPVLKPTGTTRGAAEWRPSRDFLELVMIPQRLRHFLDHKIWDVNLEEFIRVCPRRWVDWLQEQSRRNTEGTILELIQCRPEVCLEKTERGMTLLPWLCHQGGSTFETLTEVVATLYPSEIIKQQSHMGDTCLHVVARNACRFSDAKLRQLLQLCPDPAAAIVVRNFLGGTVLHAAASGAACLAAMKTIVTTNPQVLRIPSHEQIHAIVVLWQSYSDTIPGHTAIASTLQDITISEPNAALLRQFWYKVEYLATQYFVQSQQQQESSPMLDPCSSTSPNFVLHGLLQCHVPFPMVLFCLRFQPATALAVDASGNLPLHILVATRLYAGKPKEKLAVDACLRAAPSAARMPNRQGEIPLQLAIQNKVPMDVVDALLAAAPETISYRSRVDGWYPYQLAAAVQGSNVAAVNTIYCLLRQQPDLLLTR